MHSEFTPSLTRFDVITAFLRIHLWLAIVSVVMSAVPGASYFWSGIGFSIFGPRSLVVALVPVFILWMFPSLLASNSLGQTSRDPATSLADLRPLVGRCAGLFLFVQSIGQVVLFTVLFLYVLVTSPGGSVRGALFGASFPGRYMWIEVGQIVGPLLSFLIGFVLAFGPAIRDNFRAR